MTGWFIAIGVPWWAALTFVLMASLTFLGITRILCESGLAATRAQLITPTVVRSFFGTQVLGAPRHHRCAFLRSGVDERCAHLCHGGGGQRPQADRIDPQQRPWSWAA